MDKVRSVLRLMAVAVVALVGTSPFDAQPPSSSASVTPPSGEAPRLARMPSLPMRFEANAGQVDGAVRYAARGAGYALWLTDEGATLGLSGGRGEADLVLHLTVAGASPHAGQLVPLEGLETKTNYFLQQERSDEVARQRRELRACHARERGPRCRRRLPRRSRAARIRLRRLPRRFDRGHRDERPRRRRARDRAQR